MSNSYEHQNLNIDSLVPFKHHPFETYKGQRLADMAESIRTNGVIIPIVVRPIKNSKYEILSGHNRVAAASEAECNTIPAVIREDLTDEEALLIVTETNLIQRSFADLKHSERAVAIATHYNAMKKRAGYRSDLIEEIENLTGSPVANRSKTMNKLGEQYGLSKDTIARYLRIHSLVDCLKARVDVGDIAVRTAVSLSYLRDEEQEIVGKLISENNTINMKQASALREESAKGEISISLIKDILMSSKSENKMRSVKFSEHFLSQFFTEAQSDDVIEDVVSKALKLYFSQDK